MDNYENEDIKVVEEYILNIKNKPSLHNNIGQKNIFKKLKPKYDLVIDQACEDNILDPKYNFDFTNKNDKNKKFKRGGKIYKRPLGWKRYAINVAALNESVYFDDDDWIKSKDWCVAYHGTDIENIGSIASNGFLLDKGKRFKYGEGIYCSPNIETAAEYSKKFLSPSTKMYYKVVIQARVNPNSIEEIEDTDYWLIENEDDIRPYGILIKHW